MFDAIKNYFDLLEANGIRNGIEFDTILPDWSIVWLPGATDEQKAQAAALAAQAPKQPPDVDGLISAIAAAALMPPKVVPFALLAFLEGFRRIALDPMMRYASWAGAKAEPWMTPEAIEVVETLGVQFNLPLTTQQ